MESITLIWNFVIQQLSRIFNLYTSSLVLGLSLSLYVLDRLFHIFDVLRR